ncbi:hypothetical protein CEQ51_20540 [Pseudomonas thivervalensis]|uniref:Uncharacterized protein n=1 Tax=Pseudomonas thivervalensis TaxID=86265 RepID=A0A176NSC7_9PSED|nr:hypothetical protein CE140_19990 [Pseudomonas thivervalensis]AXA62360.1 hypothetical protein CEQ51_20540 [Pseudomonas thivervalensis]OAB54091.1 hypothetical protein APS14_18765 [Pseudomonas thivervalensis]
MLPLGVGAVECNEAAIFPLTIESQAKDQNQKIAAFGSSYTQPSGSKLPRHKGMSEFHCGSELARDDGITVANHLHAKTRHVDVAHRIVCPFTVRFIAKFVRLAAIFATAAHKEAPR